jgi:hypothetical protein
MAVTNLAVLLHKQEQWDEAERAYRESLRLFAELGDQRSLSQATGHLGAMYLDSGRPIGRT